MRDGRHAGADPVALRSAFLHRYFLRYLRWSAARSFHALRIANGGMPDQASGKPLIVYCNHPSWWDPAIMFLLAAALFPGRTGFAPMEAEALRRYGVMRRLGVFGLEPGTRGAAAFLVTATHVLASAERMLWITAEGAFTDPRVRPVRLQAGVAQLARDIEGAALLPLALEYTFWNESKPEALMRFGRPLAADALQPRRAWLARLENALEETMDALRADAMTRDPARFRTLLEGRVGEGGLYDLARRIGAWARLRRFDPRHER